MDPPAQILEVESLLRGSLFWTNEQLWARHFVGAACEHGVVGCVCLTPSSEAFSSLGTETGGHYL